MAGQELGERANFLAALSDKYSTGGEQVLHEGGTVPLELGQMREDDALALLQSCERTRQARQRVISLASLKRQGRPGARRGASPTPVSPQFCPERAHAGRQICLGASDINFGFKHFLMHQFKIDLSCESCSRGIEFSECFLTFKISF